jgi:hypothetical protein
MERVQRLGVQSSAEEKAGKSRCNSLGIIEETATRDYGINLTPRREGAMA